MTLSPEERRDAAIHAPIGPGLLYPDSRIVQRPGWYQLITPSAPRGALNEVVLSELAEGDVERVIDETIAAFRAAGQPTKWCVGPWTRPADLGERLARRGFESWGVRGMGCEVSRRFAPTPRVRVVEVELSGLDAFLATMWSGWFDEGVPSEADRRAHATALAATPRVVHLFAAELDGKMVGTSAVLLRDRYGYLIGGQVLESARGAGAYRAMVAARLEFLASRGLSYAVTQARAATAAPILEKLGFEALFDSRVYRLNP